MLSLREIEAADKLRGETRFRRTPLHLPTSLNRRLGGEGRLWLKLELFQRTGSFKVRGAIAKVLTLPEADLARGIVAASAGNHAQGVALAAAAVGAHARIVMPEFAPLTKREATEGYGAEVILHGSTYDEACAHAIRLCDEAQATFVHAFDDERVMAGQGTIGLEILAELPDVSTIVCPVGGGGLIAGVATAVKAIRPDVRVIGVQASGADSAVASFRAGRRRAVDGIETIADGIKVAHVGELTFEVIRARVDDMVTVDDEQICHAMLMLDEHAHVSAEPAGSVPLAAFLSGALPPPRGDVVAIVSGGNIDTFEKTRYIRRALAGQRRHHRVRVRLVDRRGSKPREMARLFGLIADHDMNVLAVSYRRDTPMVPLGLVEVELLVEARGAAHTRALDEALAESGFDTANGAGAPARPPCDARSSR